MHGPTGRRRCPKVDDRGVTLVHQTLRADETVGALDEVIESG